jgi:hypothetical protein
MRLTLLAPAIAAGCLAIGCSSKPENPEPTAAYQKRSAERPVVQVDDQPPALPVERKTIATAQTDWPGVEARLMRCQSNGNMINIEVDLYNGGQTTLHIDDYSTAEATLTDEPSRMIVGTFQRPGVRTGTLGLTQDLGPGESTTVTAVFPAGAGTQVVTLSLPKIRPMTGIRVAASKADGAPGAESGHRPAPPARNTK